MPYTATWDETQPLGTAAANTIDDLLRSFKRDIRERLNDALGISTFASADPVRIGILRFTDRLIPPAGGFTVRNNADSTDNFSIADGGNATLRGQITVNGGAGIISGSTGATSVLAFRTSTTERWIIGRTGATESGANAGSNFTIDAYSDAGAYLSTPFTIARATGNVTLGAALTLSAGNIGIATNYGIYFNSNPGTRAVGTNLRLNAISSGGVIQINNFADTINNVVIRDNGTVDIYSTLTILSGGLTINAGGANITGTLTVSAGIIGTINTPSQPNITALGTLTALNVNGTTSFVGNTSVTRAATVNEAIGIYVSGDTQSRLSITADGGMSWGPGGATVRDVSLSRGSVGLLDIGGQLRVSSTLTLINGIISMGTTTPKIIGGSTSFSIRNNADSADNITVADAGNVTVRGNLTTNAGLVVANDIQILNAASKILPGATSFSIRNNVNTQDNLLVADNGDTTVRGNLTVSGTSARVNGTLDLRGSISLGTIITTETKIIPQGTLHSIKIRDNADTFDNFIFNCDGGVLGLSGNTPEIQIAGTRVVSNRQTGWTIPTKSFALSKGNYSSGTVTLPQLADHLADLIQDLHDHGLIGA